MAGDIKLQYGTDAAFTMTGIEDVDASSTLVAGWTSALVDNSTVEALDYLISGQFTTEATNRQAGTIAIYAYGAFDDTPTWPDIFSSGTEGTVGAATTHSAEALNAGMRLLHAITTNNTASAVFTMPPTSLAQVFGGVVPNRFAIFVTSNCTTTTTDWCVATGTTLYNAPVFAQYT